MPNETASLRAAGNSAPARRAPQAPRRRRRREDSCRRTGQPNHYRDHADREIYDSDERCCVASKARRCGDQEESAATCSVTRPAVAPLVAIHSPAITSAVAAHPWASSSIGELVSLKPATISATSPNVRNSWTPEPRIARLEFDDGPDECLVRSFRSGASCGTASTRTAGATCDAPTPDEMPGALRGGGRWRPCGCVLG